MSREPKRMEENMCGSSKIIVYIAVAVAIAVVIISYVIIANTIKNNEEEQRLAELESSEEQWVDEEEFIAEVKNAENENDAESVSTQIGKTVEESAEENEKEEQSIASSTSTQEENTVVEDKANKNTNESNSNEIANAKEETQEKENKEITFVMPVDGEIVRGYAKDNLVYSETLQEWIVHQAIDIKANSRDVVKASAEGIVSAIKNDPRYGLTVIIEHEGGFKTVYSNLLTAEFVVEGEQVKQGQTIGTVGSSATFEISDEPHLHFEMLKDSVYVDPTIYIK
jgi:murein DD-endopeptidase MepM/ murein hydrolase activator NlpD